MVKTSIVFHGLLAGTSGYAMYCISPSASPWAFSGCCLGLCHGLLGIFDDFGEEADSKVMEVSTAVMEIVPLPLVNVQLYLGSGTTEIGLGHGIFILPLAFELLAGLLFEKGEEEDQVDTIKHLTILGNVTALLFLSINENNTLYGCMAFTAFLSKYGSLLMENYFEGTHDGAVNFFDAIFFLLTGIAVGGDGAVSE